MFRALVLIGFASVFCADFISRIALAAAAKPFAAAALALAATAEPFAAATRGRQPGARRRRQRGRLRSIKTN